MRSSTCAGILVVLLCSLETASAARRHAHQPSTASIASTVSEDSNTHVCDESALWLSLASFATSGAAYPSHNQHHGGRPRVGPLLEHTASAAGIAASSSQRTPNQPTPPHKPLLPQLNHWDVLLFVGTAITLFIAAGGGIGGGAVFVVLYVFVGGFTAPQAVALSNITILGGSLANFIANSSKRHPSLDRPLIYWDLILVMEPTTMLGALLGGYLNKLFPVWLTSCLLTALLTLLTWKLLKRGVSTFSSESRQIKQQQRQQQQDKQQQRQATAVIAADLQEPLLQDTDDADNTGHDSKVDDVAAKGNNNDTCVGVDGIVSPTKKAVGGQCQEPGFSSVSKHQAAWFDCNGVVDQSTVERPGTETHSTAGAVDPDSHMIVLPVPAHLKPLNVGTQQQQLQLDQQQQQGPPGSGVRLDLEQQQLLPSPRSSSAQRRGSTAEPSNRMPLLSYQSSSSSSRNGSCCVYLGCFPCFNPRKLKLTMIRAYEQQQLPWQPLLLLFFLSCWVVISDTAKVTLECGSLSYWLVALSVVPPAAAVTLLVRQWLLTKTAVEAAAAAAAAMGRGSSLPAYEASTPPPSAAAAAFRSGSAASSAAVSGGNIRWTPRNSLLYPVLCSAAGVVAGLFGVGGGIVKGPLMLELGVSPEVTAATSATMIMFTAGSAAVVYSNFGGVVTDYAVALLLLGFVVTLLGQLCTMKLVKALGRRSVIIFAMSLLMLLATGAASYQTYVAVDAVSSEGQRWWNWGSVCQHR